MTIYTSDAMKQARNSRSASIAIRMAAGGQPLRTRVRAVPPEDRGNRPGGGRRGGGRPGGGRRPRDTGPQEVVENRSPEEYAGHWAYSRHIEKFGAVPNFTALRRLVLSLRSEGADIDVDQAMLHARFLFG